MITRRVQYKPKFSSCRIRFEQFLTKFMIHFYKMTEMEKKIDDKNNEISKFRNVLSVESNSPEVIKLKNEIARVEHSAILYFQMYKKEKKLNQVSKSFFLIINKNFEGNSKQVCFISCFYASCTSSLILEISPK